VTRSRNVKDSHEASTWAYTTDFGPRFEVLTGVKNGVRHEFRQKAVVTYLKIKLRNSPKKTEKTKNFVSFQVLMAASTKVILLECYAV
jgi:hypothetical protein